MGIKLNPGEALGPGPLRAQSGPGWIIERLALAAPQIQVWVQVQVQACSCYLSNTVLKSVCFFSPDDFMVCFPHQSDFGPVPVLHFRPRTWSRTGSEPESMWQKNHLLRVSRQLSAAPLASDWNSEDFPLEGSRKYSCKEPDSKLRPLGCIRRKNERNGFYSL